MVVGTETEDNSGQSSTDCVNVEIGSGQEAQGQVIKVNGRPRWEYL